MSDKNIGFESAQEIAVSLLRRYEAEVGVPLAIIKDSTVVDERGWIFYWSTKEFVDEGYDKDPIAGNAPIIVLKDGGVYQVPTAFTDPTSIFQWLSEYFERARADG